MKTLWVIYDHPDDFPEHFVVREQHVRADKTVSYGMAKLFDTLDQARACVPPGLVQFGRIAEDAAAIVETWI